MHSFYCFPFYLSLILYLCFFMCQGTSNWAERFEFFGQPPHNIRPLPRAIIVHFTFMCSFDVYSLKCLKSAFNGPIFTFSSSHIWVPFRLLSPLYCLFNPKQIRRHDLKSINFVSVFFFWGYLLIFCFLSLILSLAFVIWLPITS